MKFQLPRGSALRMYAEMRRPGQPRDVREFLIDGPRGSSKTVPIGYNLANLAREVPGVRMLFARMTRKSITQSFCPDFETVVLPALGMEHVARGPQASHRAEYRWPEYGNSVLGLVGLDDPGKVYSTSWDLVVVDECAQVSESAFVDFKATLRQWSAGMHAQYLIGITNPRGPGHWAIKRVQAGKMRRYRSYLIDNPKWHDGTNWTPEGLAYARALASLPGVLRDRYYLGEWKAADGVVWETYDADRHIVPDAPNPPVVHVAAMDWGFTDPCVLLVGAIDLDGRVTIVREVYRSKQTIDWWTAEVLDAFRSYNLKSFVVDPSRPELIDHWNREIARATGRDIRLAKGANNRRATTPTGDLGGLDLVRRMFQRDKLFLWKGRMRHYPDPELSAASRPLSGADEIPEYCYWRPADVEEGTVYSHDKTDPACADHFCDSLRYLCEEVHAMQLRAAPIVDPTLNPHDIEDMKLLGLLA